MLPPSVKRQTTADNLLLKDRKKEWTANAQNSTFASPDTQTDTSACKRVVFLPSHQRTHYKTNRLSQK